MNYDKCGYVTNIGDASQKLGLSNPKPGDLFQFEGGLYEVEEVNSDGYVWCTRIQVAEVDF